MNWILDFKPSSITGYLELKVRYEEYLTQKAYRGFFFRIKSAVLRDKEPSDIPFCLGAPLISVFPLDGCVTIDFLSGIVPTPEIRSEIENLAAEFLSRKTSEEMVAAKAAAKDRTEAFHSQQRSYGFEDRD